MLDADGGGKNLMDFDVNLLYEIHIHVQCTWTCQVRRSLHVPGHNSIVTSIQSSLAYSDQF